MKIFVFIIIILSLTMDIMAQEGVVLLHGLCRTKSSMNKMTTALQKSGFQVENIDYPSRIESIRKISDQTIGSVLNNPKFKNCTKIHFVTHSLGGIMVRSYFKTHKFNKLGRVVMLGPPNKGSEVVDKLGAWWVFRKLNGPAGLELGTSTTSTPNQLGPVEFELGIIAGDRSINWINSMLISGQDDGKVSVERTKVAGMKEHIVLHVTHPYLMKNKLAIENTISFLKTGSFLKINSKSLISHSQLNFL